MAETKKTKTNNRLLSVFIGMLVFFAAFVFAGTTAFSAYGADASSQNYNTYSKTIKSYLIENGSGYMSVELVDDGSRLLVKYLDSSFKRTSYKYISTELSFFGGFYAGTDAYYVAYGQENPNESDSVEVIRVVKYDKDWKRIGAASLKGANTTVPFNAGSLRMAESGGYLYIRTSHQMYKSSDGLNHQANLTIQIRKADMAIVDSFYTVMNVGYGYVSHSFNQFIIVDDGNNLVGLDHGDAYPRSAVLGMYSKKAGENSFSGSYTNVSLLSFAGSVGANYTGASLGGLEYSGTHYLVAGNSIKQDGKDYSTRNIFLAVTSRSNFSEAGTTFKWITNYAEGGSASATTPHLVKLSSNSFLLLWEKDSKNISYVFLDGKGNTTISFYTKAGALSDCKPVVKSGVASWYVTDGVRTITYSIKKDGTLSSATTDYAGLSAPSGKFGTNNALSWAIDLNGKLTISGKGNIPSSQPWEKYSNGILKIEIKSGVTGIGDYAFYNLKNVENVTIANTVTRVGESAFAYCSSLTNITFPESVANISYFVFHGCNELTGVTVKNPNCLIAGLGFWNGEVEYALGNPKKVTISGYDNSTVKEYANDFGFSFKYLKFAAPKISAVNNVNAGVKITWGKITGAAKYRVFYKTGNGSWTKLADTTSTSYTWKNAKSGTKYYFTVKCISSDGKTVTSGYDSTGKAKTYIAAPKISAVNNTVSGVKITWGKVTGAAKYRVLYKTGNGSWTKITDTTSTSYTWKNAKSGTKYYFTVKCVSSDGKTVKSGYDSTGKAKTYIAAPKISSVENAATGVKITWGKVTGAAKYRVLYKTGNGSWTKIADTASTSYTWKNAKSGTKYYFTVKCVSSDGKTVNSGYDSTGKAKTYIAAPKISSVANTATGIKISWGKVNGAAKYRVFYKTGSGKWKKLTDTTSTSYTWKGAKSGTKYAFTVRCISKDGKSFTSGYDSTGKSITFIAAPKISSLSKSSAGVQIKWGKVTGAAKYKVFRKTANGKWQAIGTTASTSFIDKTAKKGTKYTYTVRCISKDGKSYTSSYNAGKSITR